MHKLFCVAISFLLLCGSARAEWYTYSPPGSVDGKGILPDVTSRCDEQGRRNAYEPDKVTYAHEATHMLNSRIRNSMGGTGRVNALYVGGGHCCILPEPHVTLETVSRYVSQFRNSTFQLYFVQQRQSWNNDPLYILDEASAYTNGLQASQELRVDEHGELERAQWFCHYSDALLEAVKRHDPNYPKLKELAEFIEWQKARVTRMAGGPVKLIRKEVQECFGGQCGGCCQQGGWQSCPSGQCGQSVYTGPIYRPQPMPQPENPPLPSPPPVATPAIGPAGPQGPAGPPGPAGAASDPKQLDEIKQLLTDIKGQPGCQCNNSKLEAKLDALIAAVTAIKIPAPVATPAAPAAEEHVVIVADHNGPYWQKLADAMNKTRQTYHGLQDTTPPDFLVDTLPQAVVYRNSVPVRIVKGEYQVEDLLARLSRGDSI